MTLEELDHRTTWWHQIANGHRQTEDRIDIQITHSQQAMCEEFLHWRNEWLKFESEYTTAEILLEILHSYALARFEATELLNLANKTQFFKLINEHNEHLFKMVNEIANTMFEEETLLEAYSRVIECNFSRFIKSEDVDIQDAVFEANRLTEAYGLHVMCDPVGEYWVFRDQNGIIRTPYTYQPVDLSDLINC